MMSPYPSNKPFHKKPYQGPKQKYSPGPYKPKVVYTRKPKEPLKVINGNVNSVLLELGRRRFVCGRFQEINN